MGRRAERRAAILGPSLLLLGCSLGVYLHASGIGNRPPPHDLEQRLQRAHYQQWQAGERQRRLRREAMLRPERTGHHRFVRQLVHTYGADYERAVSGFLDDVTAWYWQDLDASAIATSRRRLADVLLVREMVHVSWRDGATLSNTYVIQNHSGSDRRSRIHKRVGEEWIALADLAERYADGGGRADRITRVPELFLADLFSEQPAYELLDGRGRLRRVHTYGDCDEFEMAYVHLLAALDIEADVILPRSLKRKSHVRTRIAITEDDAPLWLEVDNTHRTVRTTATRPAAWTVPSSHYNVAWINDHAIQQTRIEVGRQARERIDARVRRTLGLPRAPRSDQESRSSQVTTR